MKRTLWVAAAAMAVMVAGGAGAQDRAMPADGAVKEPSGALQQDRSATVTGRDHWTNASLEDLIGQDVYGSDGTKLGEVADIILDADTKQATLALVDHGGFLGLGTKQAPIDINLMRAEGDRIVIDGMTKEQIQAMADFDYEDTTVSLGRTGEAGAPRGTPGQPLKQ